MKTKHIMPMVVGATALIFSVTGCASSADSMDHMSHTASADNGTQAEVINMFGGPAYLGAPNLELTAALVKAGGGAGNFSTAQALTAMLGAKTVQAEVAKLTEQYGKTAVQNWLAGTDAVVASALQHATEMGISLPPAPAGLTGADLAVALVQAGTAPDGTFWSGRFYDTLVSHDIHNRVMAEVNANPDLGYMFDKNVHKISNQAFYDVAQALGHESVKLASLH